jgi:hypothetical protein
MNQEIKQKFILGIDIGGGHISAALYKTNEDGSTDKKDTWNINIPPQKGLDNHVNQIAKIISQAEKETKNQNGILCGIGIGSPGRFTKDGIIKPGTNTNLGNTPDEFDEINLKEKYKEALDKDKNLANLPLYVRNDGDVMLLGIIDSITPLSNKEFKKSFTVSKKEFFQKPQIGSLTIGTGVGNAFYRFNRFVTDGHASKILLTVDDKDLNLFFKAIEIIENKTKKQEVFFKKITCAPDIDNDKIAYDTSIRVEDLFRGPMINALAGVEHGKNIAHNNPDHQKALKFAGKYMARLIQKIKTGKSEDINKENEWTDREKNQAAATSAYVIGGGVGCSDTLGPKIIEYAYDELKNLEITNITLIQNKHNNVATYAAAKLIPEELYRKNSPSDIFDFSNAFSLLFQEKNNGVKIA